MIDSRVDKQQKRISRIERKEQKTSRDEEARAGRGARRGGGRQDLTRRLGSVGAGGLAEMRRPKITSFSLALHAGHQAARRGKNDK